MYIIAESIEIVKVKTPKKDNFLQAYGVVSDVFVVM